MQFFFVLTIVRVEGREVSATVVGKEKKHQPFRAEAQTALFKAPVRTAL